MASISGAAAPPSSSACRLRLRRHLLLRPSHLRLRAPHSIADLSHSSSSSPAPLEAKPAQDQNGAHGRGSVEKDPIKLWNRYLEWLYQHKELGLFVDVSRMGFTEDFLQQIEPRMQRAFTAMRDLEKGAIANPDESRMVGHYWLRNPELAPNSFLRSKIENALGSILAFSHDVGSGALQGIDVKEMLVGAALMDEETRNTVVKENPAALLALCWYWATEGIGNKDMVVLPYKDSLLLLSRYLQQLVMESLGKEFDLDGNPVNQGLTVYGNKGSTDQHAYIQQPREGVHNLFVTFIEVLRDRPPGHYWELEPGVTCGDYLFGMLQGTRSALYANDRESISVTVQEVTPRAVGALIALYERAVGIYASLVNINAYHQPGVEAGKKAAGEVLALQKRVLLVLNEASCEDPAEPLTIDEIADLCHCPEDIEMIYKIVQHMAANDRAIIAEGSCGSPRSIKVYLGECNVDEDEVAA